MATGIRIELQLRPVQCLGLELELEYLPDFQLIRHLNENAFPLKERTRLEIIRTIRLWADSFRDHYLLSDLEDPKKLEEVRKAFSSIYCSLNFLVPEWELNEELAQTRENFLRDMRKLGVSDALTLYHQPPDSFGSTPYNLKEHFRTKRDNLADQLSDADGSLGREFSSLEAEPLDSPLISRDERLKQRIIKAARDFHYRKTPIASPYSLATQLDYLVRVIINPEMGGVALGNPSQEQAEEKYRQIAGFNGPFVMPLPRLKR